ncbi:peroxiredoxin family protein [Bacillus sp. CHD6a]|uniref:peroxiredoxin family protein n=1 Tax=Bacillus sp. CHD6a TaxID=1643452 RepID=UPI0006CD8ED8|nr:peroxiredoxin family protein [Bacillus sp. CHD6a]KPB04065.1 peroxiredoxin [Bacillus sp. CHD6a]
MGYLKLKDKAPEFKLTQTTGETFSFDAHQKEHEAWHLIVFFRGSWCPVCQDELKELEESKGYFEDKKVHVLAISTEEADKLKEMVSEYDLTMPVLSDPKLEALEAYGVYYHGEDAPYEDHGVHGEPAYFLVDEKGKLLYQQRQTSPFGRPSVSELRKIVKYIGKNLK